MNNRIYVIRGKSMAPSFREGDWVMVNCGSYLKTGPKRGDVVLLRDPRGGNLKYMKRIVGLPGENLLLGDGVLFLSGVHFYEPYLSGLPSSIGLNEIKWTVDDCTYIVLGDRRAHSTDSRTFGPVSYSDIIGKVWLRFWPFSRWTKL